MATETNANEMEVDNTAGDDKGKPELATKKRSPNRLIVDDVTEVVQGEGDNSCVLLSPAKMEGTMQKETNTCKKK